MKLRLFPFAIGIAIACSSAGPLLAQADAPTAALAEKLFLEGKRLMAEKRYDEACPKLAESQRLDPGGGTLLTLAICQEARGKTASAWSTFREALALAERDRRRDRERVARARIAEIEPRLSHIVVHVPEAVRSLRGLGISQDGVPLGEAAWEVPNPVDPGEHVIEVTATGKRAWSTTVTMERDAQSLRVEVPSLEDEPAPEPAAAATAPIVKPASPPLRQNAPEPARSPALEPVPSGDGLVTAGWIAGGVGVTSAIVASVFTLRAISKSDAADERCPSSACSDAEAVRLNEQAASSADYATAGFAVAGVALGFAVYALLIHPSPDARSSRAELPPLLLRW